MNKHFQNRTLDCTKLTGWILFALSSLLLLSSCESQRQNRPSPLRSDSATVLGIPVYIEYSSPAVQSRKIFGSDTSALVPYNKVWRTGANDATFISIAASLTFDAQPLDSGTYSLFTIPSDSSWVVILNKEWNQWGSYNYKDSLDVARITVIPKIVDTSHERLLFYFAEDSLKFRWDRVRWAIPINLPEAPR